MNGPCQNHQDLILDAALGQQALSPSLSEHIKSCRDCARFQRDLDQHIESLTVLGQSLQADMPDRLERCLLAVKQASQGRPQNKRRKSMIPLTKLSLAAVLAVAIGLTTLIKTPSSEPTFPEWLSKVQAAENAWFSGPQTVYIRNEITVYPTATGQALGFTWIPMASMKADGQLRMDQLKLSVTSEPYTVLDQAWYDPPTGRFVRQLETDQDLVFANSYDGHMVFTTAVTQNGLEIQKHVITGQFVPPSKPAQFFGLGAGLKSGLDEKSTQILDRFQETLVNGAAVHVFKVGTPDPDGQVQAYWLFRVRDDNHTVAEMEFVMEGQTQLLIRRVTTEYVEAPEVSWDLRELATRSGQTNQENRVTLTPDMVISDVSVQHMVEKASFETYVFAQCPTWCESMTITDVIDPASFGKRMFATACRASDKRHVVLIQSPSYNQMLGMVIRQGELVYESPNGFKVIGGGRSKWLANILLQSAKAQIKDPPAEDRVGFILESPAGTYPALAINGPVSDEELHGLIDSLMPAKEYLEKAKP